MFNSGNSEIIHAKNRKFLLALGGGGKGPRRRLKLSISHGCIMQTQEPPATMRVQQATRQTRMIELRR